jgi:hypothetical protein
MDLVKRKKRTFSPLQHSQQTQSRLIVGGMLILLLVGGGLVWVIYGPAAAMTAVACLLAASGVFGLLWLILALLERWVKDDEA